MSVKILSTVESNCTTNPQQIDVKELEGYRWSTCSKQPRLVDRRIGVVNKLDRRRRRLAAAKCFKSGVWDKVPEESTLIFFEDTQISLKHSVG